MKYFLENVLEVLRRIEDLLKTNTTMNITGEKKRRYVAWNLCNLCKTTFINNNQKVINHSHLSGKSRQTICNSWDGEDKGRIHYATILWDYFGCRTSGEYSELYLKEDVLLLTDVFENFCNIYIKTYNIYPALYYTVSELSFDSILKLTPMKLNLLSNFDMLLMFKKCLYFYFFL